MTAPRIHTHGSNAEKAKQLGMPAGTATGRLRKMVILRLLQRLGDDLCFVCGGVIREVGDLTMEHRKPWMYVDAALFWDLDNIAFSHAKCNRPHRQSYGSRIVCDEGKSWCGRCRQQKPVAEFTRHKRRWTGLSSECRACKGTTPR